MCMHLKHYMYMVMAYSGFIYFREYDFSWVEEKNAFSWTFDLWFCRFYV